MASFKRRRDSTPAHDEVDTTERISALGTAGAILDGVLREARAHDAAYRGRAAPRSAATGTPLVLVVDDDADWRSVCQETLQLGGFRVITAGDGIEAWVAAASAGPQLIITDFAMPILDGARFAERLKADDRTRAIPLVMISAYAGEVPAEARRACDAFLAKPCEPAELCRLAVVMVAAARAASASAPPPSG